MTNTAKAPKTTAPVTIPAGTKVRITRGPFRGRETVVTGSGAGQHVLEGQHGYVYKATSLKVI